MPVDHTAGANEARLSVVFDLTFPDAMACLERLIWQEACYMIMIWVGASSGAASAAREKPLPGLAGKGAMRLTLCNLGLSLTVLMDWAG